jgi:hypothetical protein
LPSVNDLKVGATCAIFAESEVIPYGEMNFCLECWMNGQIAYVGRNAWHGKPIKSVNYCQIHGSRRMATVMLGRVTEIGLTVRS